MKKTTSGKRRINKKKIIVFSVIIALIVGFSVMMKMGRKKMQGMENQQIQVSRRDITATITGTAVVRPKEEYMITSLINGEVVEANFEEGDFVNEGDVLYQIDASDIEKDIISAELAVQRAQQNYDDAVNAKSENAETNRKNLDSADLAKQNAQKNYNDAVKVVEDLNVKSDISGKVGEIFVEEGDSISAGMNVARIYDDSSMQIKVPFNEEDALNIGVGQSAEVTVTGSGEVLAGIVVGVNSASEVKKGYMVVRYVTIRVDSPGALSKQDSATAKIGDAYCNDAGTFEYANEMVVTAKSSGTVKNINIEKGNEVIAGSTIVTLENETAESQKESARISLEDAGILYDKTKDTLDSYSPDSQIANAEIALEEAKISLEKIKATGEDYKITAPSSGQVIAKNLKAGDKVDTMSAQEPMAVIYDMSSLKFELMIDELDINKISVGQKVKITADALNGKEYYGVVGNVSIDGEEENGVTSYPVMVNISEFDGDLLPGMNIDAEIAVGNVKNVLAIPKSAVTRDNIVFVAGEKEDALDDAPEGYRSVKVVTGLNDGDYIEIVSGLSEADVVKIETIESSSGIPMMAPHATSGGVEE